MSLINIADLWEPILVAAIIAIISDIGCFYRARLMYSATHEGISSPNLFFKPSPRHIFLAIAAILGVYLYIKHDDQVNSALGGLMASLALYGGLMYRDVISVSAGRKR